MGWGAVKLTRNVEHTHTGGIRSTALERSDEAHKTRTERGLFELLLPVSKRQLWLTPQARDTL